MYLINFSKAAFAAVGPISSGPMSTGAGRLTSDDKAAVLALSVRYQMVTSTSSYPAVE